jgi:hypothetical protein
MTGKEITYETGVRSFDHSHIARYPSYPRLREVLSDLANEIAQARDAGEDEGMKISEWLEVLRDAAMTAPYADMCEQCSDEGRSVTSWPYRAEVRDGWLHGYYRCPDGHHWTCGYSVSAPWLH